jgi:ferrochelatase
LGRDKLARVDVVCPGFAVDCLETLEEIAIRYAKLFAESGGGALNYIPALNAGDDHIEFLVRLIERNAAGWPELSPDWTASETARELNKSRQRALAAGAPR